MTEAKATPKRRVKLLLDYDGCCDILFWKEYPDSHYDRRWRSESSLAQLPPLPEETRERWKNEYRTNADTLEAFLDEITKDADVEVIVWSNRQANGLNKENGTQYENGDCFSNFETLCNQKGWRFNKLLVSDVLLGYKPGTVMERRGTEQEQEDDYEAIMKFYYKSSTRPQEYQGLEAGLALKAYTLENHFPKGGPQDQKEKTEEDWYALDDKGEVVRGIKWIIQDSGKLSVPENIRLHVYQFSRYMKKPGQISVHGRAQAETKPIQPDTRPANLGTQLSEDSLYARTGGFFKRHPGITKVIIFSAVELFSLAVLYGVAAKVDAVRGFMSSNPANMSPGIEKLATPITPYLAAFMICVICVSIYESRKSKGEKSETRVADRKHLSTSVK